MSKLSLPDIGSLANSASARQSINDNFTAIEEAIENTLSRDGATPNQMEADLDLNSNSVINVADPVADMDAVNKRSVGPLVVDAVGDLLASLGEASFVREIEFAVSAGDTSVDLADYLPFVAIHALFYNGIFQNPSSYSLGGSTVTFTETLPEAGKVVVVVSNTTSIINNSDNLSNTVALSGGVTRSIRDKLSDTISVKDFGAVGDGVTDDTAAINAALDCLRTRFITPANNFDVTLDFAGGVYRVTSINATGIRQPGLRLVNGHLVGYGGGIVLDMAGTNGPVLDGITIFGDEADPPKVGLLLARGLSGSSYPAAASARLFRVDINGYFTAAACINFASEVSSVHGCVFQNKSRDTDAVAFALVASNAAIASYLNGGIDLTSAYATIPSSATGTHSTICHYFGGCQFLRGPDVSLAITSISQANPAVVAVNAASLAAAGFSNGAQVFFHDVAGMTQLNGNVYTIANLNTAAGTFELSGTDSSAFGVFAGGTLINRTGPAVLLSGCGMVNAKAAYVLTYGSPAVIIDGVSGGSVRDIDLEFQPEAACTSSLRFDVGGSDRVFQGVRAKLLTANQYQADGIVDVSTSGGIARVDGFELIVPNAAAIPAAGVFNAPASMRLNAARIQLPTVVGMNALATFAAFNGEVIGFNTTPPTHMGSNGSYTPTVTLGANAAAATPYETFYTVVGNMVTVSGRIDIDPTAASVQTIVDLSLPIASNLTQTYHVAGVAACRQSASLSAGVFADIVGKKARIEYVNTADVASRVWSFSFHYLIR